MNKFFFKSFRSVHYGYRVTKSLIQPKELKIYSQELDLTKERVSPEELTVLICHQIDPQNLLKIYSRYKNQFSDRHLLQCLKITAKMQGMFYVPVYDEQFQQVFLSLLAQFNQYIHQLNNLDLADFVYWYKKVQNDTLLQNNLNVINEEVLFNTIQKNVDENLFLPRQMNMIYECLDQVFPEKEHLKAKLLSNVFATQDITPTQILQFITTLSKRFIMKKKLELYGSMLLLQYLNQLNEGFDVDQNSSMLRPLMNLKLHLYVTEQVYLQTIKTRFNYAKLNLKYLESGTLLSILHYYKCQGDSLDPELFFMIHEQMMKKFIKNPEDANIEFLISYLDIIYKTNFKLDKDIEILEEFCLQLLEQYGEQSNLNQFAEYLIQRKVENEKFNKLILNRMNELSYFNIGQYIQCLQYLHFICKININQYLRVIYNTYNNNFQMALEISLNRNILINLIVLSDEYHIQIPEGIEQQFAKLNYITQLQAIAGYDNFNERLSKILFFRLQYLKHEKKFDRRLWPVLVSLIRKKEDAVNLFKIFISNFRSVVSQIFHIIYIQNEFDNATKEQAYFFYLLFQDSIEILNIEILINGLVYNTKMMRFLIDIDPTIMDIIFSQSFKYNQGLGTALLIQLLEISYKDLSQFRIHQQLIYNYKQLSEYDSNFILMMIKYNCYPLQDSNKIFHNLISFTSNELKMFILYLDMSSKLGFQKLQPHIFKQIKKLNETYVIQIQ